MILFKRNLRLLFWLALLIGLGLAATQIFPLSDDRSPADLRLNEFLASNGAGLTDEDGDYSDWIEIYNASSRPVNLSGWALTDEPDQPTKWPFPDLTLGGHEYLVIFASGKDRRLAGPERYLHTNFKLSKTGEPLGLYSILDDSFADFLPSGYPEQFRDIAYGRNPAAPEDDPFGYLLNPTPGERNDQTQFRTGMADAVLFSPQRGFYDTPFQLALTSATPGATIRYTTDGSRPDETHGTVYTGPIAIDRTTTVRTIALAPDSLPSAVNTHTYIFLDTVLNQPPDPPGFPQTWGVHGEDSVQYGYVDGAPVIADYEMDPEIVNDPRYRAMLNEGLLSIPSISLVMPLESFDQLYSNTKARGRTWERPVSVELIVPGQPPDQGFQINAGLRIQGEAGRRDYMPKHSFRLFFRGDYGATRLDYPLFPDSPVDSFNTLVLRGGVNRSYAGRPGRDHRLATYTRDEWLRASQIAVSGAGSHGIFVHLYLNGLYWGLYNVVERPDASFLAAYFGGRPRDWYAANHSGPISGSAARFEELLALAQGGGFEDPERYAALQSYVDIPHFIDFIILNWYAGNSDWAHTNWYLGLRNPAGQVKLFVWDAETTWDEGAWLFMGHPEPTNLVEPLFKGLIQNPDFKMTLADRLHRHLFNTGPLTETEAKARWRTLNEAIGPAIVGESARWGDARYEPPITYDDWLKARQEVLAQMEGNPARLISLAREAGYYPPVDPPTFSQQGGPVPLDFKVEMARPPAADGTIYYTTDGSDPRLPVTGAPSPRAMVYQTPLVLTTTTQLKARFLANDLVSDAGPVWSALNEATFNIRTQGSELRITEIMYNPPGGGSYEFIELKNIGQQNLVLANLYFEGIRFTFPPTTPPLPPDNFVVLVRDGAAFTERYPDVPIGGLYNGQLSNTGEDLTIKDRYGETILSVTFNDGNRWPLSADGQGDSLVLVDLNGDPSDPRNWRASTELYGSPGKDDPAVASQY
jgi:hypothetical protein